MSSSVSVGTGVFLLVVIIAVECTNFSGVLRMVQEHAVEADVLSVDNLVLSAGLVNPSATAVALLLLN